MSATDLPYEARSPAAAAARRGPGSEGRLRRRTLAAVNVATAAAILLTMPALYALLAFRGDDTPLSDPKIAAHLAIACSANVVVALGAIRTHGRLDQKLGQLVSLTLLTHGTIAFLILMTRTYYSIPVMLVASCASFAWGVAAILARGRLVKLRVAIVGPRHAILADPNLHCTHVAPDADPSEIDLVLVTWRKDQSFASEPFVTRALLAGKRVRHVAEFVEEVRGACELDHFDIEQISPAALTRHRLLKRVFDIVFVIVVLPLVIPIVLVAMAAILVTMGWPVLFIQPRLGLRGRTFRMLKLRTMRPQPAGAAASATLKADARVTPLGRVLRRFRIDELPQLLNVVAGDMSIIGPRPEQPALASAYLAHTPHFAFRLLVRPGITGWAQVRAGYAADLAENRVKLSYDLFYIKNFSLGLDLRILAWTVWTLTNGGGVR